MGTESTGCEDVDVKRAASCEMLELRSCTKVRRDSGHHTINTNVQVRLPPILDIILRVQHAITWFAISVRSMSERRLTTYCDSQPFRGKKSCNWYISEFIMIEHCISAMCQRMLATARASSESLAFRDAE